MDGIELTITLGLGALGGGGGTAMGYYLFLHDKISRVESKVDKMIMAMKFTNPRFKKAWDNGK